MIIVEEGQVFALLTMRDCIEQMSLALTEFSRGKIDSPSRKKYRFGANDGTLFIMPASSESLGVYGVKLIAQHLENPSRGLPAIRGHLALFDYETGSAIGLVESSAITFLRTAATSALATRELARQTATTHGVFGAGAQALAHLKAISCVRDIREIRVWARNIDKAKSFVDKHRNKTVSKLVAVTSAKEAAKSDIVSCTTAATKPIIFDEWLNPGTHVNLIGSHSANARECDSELVCHSTVFVDSRKAASKEAGDLIIPHLEGVAPDIQSYGELGELVSGKTKGRTSSQETTLFKSVGIAAMDLFAAKFVVDRARVQESHAK